MASPTTAATSPISSLSDDVPVLPGRRSSRAKKAVQRYENDDDYATPSRQPQSTLRKVRPKRKAAAAANESILPEDAGPLLQEILAKMTPDERKEYHGWVELESEPGFFNAMLQDLGATDFKVQEVFGLDEFTLAELSKPVHGLIFLYQYTEGEEPTEGRQECPGHLWFANQTTANACATVALMNIIMNAEGASFGNELQEFKDSTKSMPAPHRGHMLDINDFIRAIHNSVARRIDLTSEDLLLDNKYEAWEKWKARKNQRQKPNKRKSSSSSKKAQMETAFHYIAYVPVNGQVWELDGLETQPRCIGPYQDRDSWLDTAGPAIQSRMLDEALSFNLLAICRSPLASITQALAANTAACRALDTRFGNDAAWTPAVAPGSDSPPPSTAAAAAEAEAEEAPTDIGAARQRAQELEERRAALQAQRAVETAAAHEAVALIRARQRDYTPAIHEWVAILAEKGALRELITAAADAETWSAS